MKGACHSPHLVDGAAMIPRSRILATQMGCSTGMGKMCFTKNVFSSTVCQQSMKEATAKTRIHEHEGSIQRVEDHDSGVNWRSARFSLPELELENIA